jgi:putative RNA 2'-phosphotransferase
MHPKEMTKLSHALSALLRHGAGERGLPMDAAGWAPIDAVLAAVRTTRERLDAVVRDNNKSRLEVADGRIRACQGHSLAGMPVTLEALEASWTLDLRDEPVWHGTHLSAVAPIAREGIHAGERTHVHLAAETDSTVGKRANVDVMLRVDPARLRAEGIGLYRSGNGVLLARRVPATCITGLRAETRAARAEEDRLRGLFDVPGSRLPLGTGDGLV